MGSCFQIKFSATLLPPQPSRPIWGCLIMTGDTRARIPSTLLGLINTTEAVSTKLVKPLRMFYCARTHYPDLDHNKRIYRADF